MKYCKWLNKSREVSQSALPLQTASQAKRLVCKLNSNRFGDRSFFGEEIGAHNEATHSHSLSYLKLLAYLEDLKSKASLCISQDISFSFLLRHNGPNLQWAQPTRNETMHIVKT